MAIPQVLTINAQHGHEKTVPPSPVWGELRYPNGDVADGCATLSRVG